MRGRRERREGGSFNSDGSRASENVRRLPSYYVACACVWDRLYMYRRRETQTRNSGEAELAEFGRTVCHERTLVQRSCICFVSRSCVCVCAYRAISLQLLSLSRSFSRSVRPASASQLSRSYLVSLPHFPPLASIFFFVLSFSFPCRSVALTLYSLLRLAFSLSLWLLYVCIGVCRASLNRRETIVERASAADSGAAARLLWCAFT